jgi:hypothetical protein
MQEIDIRGFSFDEFVAFVFDRDVSTESKGKDYWYWHVEVNFDAARIVGYYQKLFERPEFLLERFSRTQLEEGFWAVHGPNLDCAVSQIIDDDELPLSIRKACIRSMTEFFGGSSRRTRSTRPSTCGGIPCATTGIAEIGFANGAARIWSCRIRILRHSPRSSGSTRTPVKPRPCTVWDIFIIRERKS